jgi:hypothetical protein
MNSSLIPSISLADFLATRDGILDRFEQVQRLLIEADAMAKRGGFGKVFEGQVTGQQSCFGHWKTCGRPIRHWLTDGSVVDRMAHVDAHGWSHLISQTGLRSFMDTEARADWDKQLELGTAPPITRELIAGVFSTLNDDRLMMMERGVISVFRGLSWDHKTNQPAMFGKKIIVLNMLTYGGSLDTQTADRLDDLIRAMCWLDGKPEPDHRSQIWNTAKEGAGLYDMEYMLLKVHKKGTGHITFKRLDLLDRLNGVIAKHHPNALPAPK